MKKRAFSFTFNLALLAPEFIFAKTATEIHIGVDWLFVAFDFHWER